jgi:prefoldin subunit 5
MTQPLDLAIDFLIAEKTRLSELRENLLKTKERYERDMASVTGQIGECTKVLASIQNAIQTLKDTAALKG